MSERDSNFTPKLYLSLLSNDRSDSSNWKFIKRLLTLEYLSRVGMRTQKNVRPISVMNPLTKSLLATEVFPDRQPPEVITAEGPEMTHDDLRVKYKDTHPASEKRISGDILETDAFGKIIVLDAFLVSQRSLKAPTVATTDEIVEFLTNSGYLPVDRLFDIIPSKLGLGG